jgi:hypothetical protein
MAGALGDLFAPAFIRGDPASEEEVKQWMARHYRVTNPMVEETRTPVSFPTGNPAGMVDVEALRALAQGGDYDINARRNSIAAALQAQQAAQPAPAAASNQFAGGIPYGLPSQGFLPLPGQNWYGGPMASS